MPTVPLDVAPVPEQAKGRKAQKKIILCLLHVLEIRRKTNKET